MLMLRNHYSFVLLMYILWYKRANKSYSWSTYMTLALIILKYTKWDFSMSKRSVDIWGHLTYVLTTKWSIRTTAKAWRLHTMCVVFTMWACPVEITSICSWQSKYFKTALGINSRNYGNKMTENTFCFTTLVIKPDRTQFVHSINVFKT